MAQDGEILIPHQRALRRALRRAGVNGTETGTAYGVKLRSVLSRQRGLNRPARFIAVAAGQEMPVQPDGRETGPPIAVRLFGTLAPPSTVR